MYASDEGSLAPRIWGTDANVDENMGRNEAEETKHVILVVVDC